MPTTIPDDFDDMLPADPNLCLSSSQAKRMDRIAIGQLGISGMVLMENAGIRCAQFIAGRFMDARIVVLCGTGNNGGDGLVIARQLAVCGHPVVVWVSDSTSGMSREFAANQEILKRLDLPNLEYWKTEQLPELPTHSGTGVQTVIIDAMLGISGHGEPREPMATAVRWANRQPAIRVAIDVPTGLDPDSGKPANAAFRAGFTLAIERPKSFATNPSASGYVGELIVVPLGIPAWVAEKAPEDSA